MPMVITFVDMHNHLNESNHFISQMEKVSFISKGVIQ